MRIRVLSPDPDLEAEGLAAGCIADMPDVRAEALVRRGLVEMLPPEIQAHAGAPERKPARAAARP